MSLIIVITIRIGRPVLIKKLAQSFADSSNTDPSPSDMRIDFVAKNDVEGLPYAGQNRRQVPMDSREGSSVALSRLAFVDGVLII